MPNLTISYLDHYLHLAHTSRQGLELIPFHALVYTEDQFLTAIQSLQQGVDVWIWYNHSLSKIAKMLHQQFIFVKAAGGLVQCPSGERLLIHREGHWDIPKGMVEPHESIPDAAIREVQEETGLTQLSLGPLITKTYHIYDKYGGWHLKQTSWFQMFTPQAAATTPQQEEGITECRWVSPTQCAEYLNQSFASLRLVSQHLQL